MRTIAPPIQRQRWNDSSREQVRIYHHKAALMPLPDLSQQLVAETCLTEIIRQATVASRVTTSRHVDDISAFRRNIGTPQSDSNDLYHLPATRGARPLQLLHPRLKRTLEPRTPLRES